MVFFAQAYGEGSYNTGEYGTAVISLGPVNLPITGGTLALMVVCAAMIAAGVGILVWRIQKQKRSRNA